MVENCGYTTYVEVFALGHNFVDGICTLCGKKVSEGLRYELSEDGTGYEVVGIGSCKDTDLVIPSTYDNLPVTAIGRWAFAGCESLTSISFNGTIAQWNAIEKKDSSWKSGVPAKEVVCSDGKVAI